MKKLIISGAVYALLSSPLVLAAEDHGVYVGASVGRMSIDFDEASVSDKTTNASKLFLGYNFNPYFALEGSYYDTSSYKLNNDTTAEISGFSVAVLAGYPISEHAKVFAKLGYIDGKSEWEDSSVKGTLDRNSVLYGIGASYSFGDFAVRAEYERAKDEDALDIYTLGLQYSF